MDSFPNKCEFPYAWQAADPHVLTKAVHLGSPIVIHSYSNPLQKDKAFSFIPNQKRVYK